MQRCIFTLCIFLFPIIVNFNTFNIKNKTMNNTIVWNEGGNFMKKRTAKWLTTILLSATMILGLTACNSKSEPTTGETTAESKAEYNLPSNETEAAAVDKANVKEIMNIAVSQEGANYDVHKTTTLVARQLFSGTVWEKLVTLNGNAEVVPELCSSWEMSEDATTFTFNLREGVLFHDGTELKADDVVASMNRWIEAFSTAKDLVGNGRFEKVDDYTVKIVCDSAALTLVDMMAGAAQPAIVTTKSICENEDENGYLKEYIGTGPYKFVEWVQGQYITFEKFDDYVPYYLEGTTEEIMDGWAGYKHAYTKQLKFWYVPEAATRVAGLQTGQYDVILSLDSENSKIVEGSTGLEVASEQAGTIALVFNKSEESIAQDINIRHAVNAVANSDDLMMSAFGDYYDLGSCYMDESNAFWLTDAGSEYYNIKDEAKAKEYLETAGYNGETFKILAPTLNHYDNIALVLKAELEAIGMTVEVETVDWATFTTLREDKTVFDLYITSFASVPVPSLKAYYGPEYPGWTVDDTMAEKLAAFNQSTTKEQAYEAWVALQQYSWEYLPCINAGHYGTGYGYSEAVSGLSFGNGVYFWDAYIPQ
ncbi:MAG: transporter peptide-binding protein [Anaerocolumna sp.]|nr:transporter peptide-binding protein [Anaerocolumna sp.]